MLPAILSRRCGGGDSAARQLLVGGWSSRAPQTVSDKKEPALRSSLLLSVVPFGSGGLTGRALLGDGDDVA